MSLRETETLQYYRTAFEASASSGWLRETQSQAFEAFADCGFPSRKLEEWRYTNVTPIAREHWNVTAATPATVDLELPDFGGNRVVFVDGQYVEAASHRTHDAAIEVRTLSDAAAGDRVNRYGTLATCKDEGFTAFNTAFANDGAIVTLKQNHTGPSPLHLVFASTDSSTAPASFPRVLIRAEPDSHGRVVLDHVSAGRGAHLCCAVSEIFVEDNAALELFLVQRENDESYHVSRQCVQQQRNSRFSIHTLNLGNAILRNDLEVVLAESGALCNLEGLFLGRGKQLVDNHTLVDHAMPQCESRERYKGIVADQSRGVFRGRVIVRPDAQQTTADQQNQNLVLGPSAEIDTKPQLEIYADDVKCSHGSSIGQLDAEALFFLRARGLDERIARALLMTGFASQITQSIPHDGLRDWTTSAVKARLETLFVNGGDA